MLVEIEVLCNTLKVQTTGAISHDTRPAKSTGLYLVDHWFFLTPSTGPPGGRTFILFFFFNYIFGIKKKIQIFIYFLCGFTVW